MGYNQEISIKQSTLGDIQNRILTVEMKVAENPAAEEGLKTIIAKHEASKSEVESQIKLLEEKIADVRAQVDAQNEALNTIDNEEDDHGHEQYEQNHDAHVHSHEVPTKTEMVPPVTAPEPEIAELPQKKVKQDEQPQYELGVAEQQPMNQSSGNTDQQAEV